MGDRGKRRCCPSRTNGKERCGVDESVVMRYRDSPCFAASSSTPRGALCPRPSPAADHPQSPTPSIPPPHAKPPPSSPNPNPPPPQDLHSLYTQRLDCSRTIRFPSSPQLRPLSAASHGGQKHRQDDAGLHHHLDGTTLEPAGTTTTPMTLGPVAVVGRAADAAWHGGFARRGGAVCVNGSSEGSCTDAEAMGSAKKASRGLGVAIDKHTHPRVHHHSIDSLRIGSKSRTGSPPANVAAATMQQNGSASLVQMCPSLYRAALRGRTDEVMALLLQQRYGSAARTSAGN
ncbi:hypothetical protein HU200_029184 [Digitaria exilis]|uniref:Uncharacterized protein n=1 Tax=Digitaria exilis TaxID=1010633 RepID=A0A835BT70_9POAL|nr:hypothetical protein HU200_029184 [Digitaria exilis]CAB3489351.1 unnamed protein product [Digitaria exilis]